MAGTVRRNGAYAPLGARYYDDDAIIEAGEKAEVLYCRGLAFCSSTPSDGYITESQVARIGIGLSGLKDRVRRLVTAGLWLRVEGGYQVRAWLKWNKSAEEIGRTKAKDRDRKAAGKEPDSETIPDGIQPEPERNPDGVVTDSEPRAGARETPARTTTHHNTSSHITTVEQPSDLTVLGSSTTTPQADLEHQPHVGAVETVDNHANGRHA